jgi:predicted dehydrogenase
MEESARSALEDKGKAGMWGAGVRAGVIGAGFVGRIHARSARLAGGRLAGVVASSPERSEVAARELGAERTFATADELIASDDVDVVHVCTPNNLHLPIALAALARGKHVVCEKPIALDTAGATELLGAAQSSRGTVVTVPLVYRYYPTVREARDRLRAGGDGDVRLISGGYLQDWLLRDDDDNWRVDAKLGGASRAFADIGSHWADLVEFVSGHRITSVVARTLIAHPERRHEAGRHSFESGGGDGAVRSVTTEDAALVMFETDRGALGSVVVSQVSAGRKNRLWFEISTTSEGLAFDQEQPETLWVGRRERADVIPRDFATLAPDAAHYVTLPAGHPQGYHDCFDAFVAETYEAIRTGEAADGLPGLPDGLRSLRITEAVLESARERRWVEVRSG